MDRPASTARLVSLGLLVSLSLLLTLAPCGARAGESASAAPSASCGDGTCDPGETPTTCPQDCGILLLEEDFEAGQPQDWFYDPAQWEVVPDGGSQVWRPTQGTYAAAGGAHWKDYVWFLRARRFNADAILYLRTDWPNGYGLQLEHGRIVLWTERDGYVQELASGNVALGTTWHDYRIEAAGTRITVQIDGAPVIDYVDGPAASLRGGIGLESFAFDGARFDDILVYSTLPQCYDGQRNGDETGVDCGGSCPNQDCCTNRAWDADLGEGGVDCGAICGRDCQPPDRPDRWTQTNGPWLEYILRIRTDPGNPDTLLASSNTGSGVVKSTDAGQTWHELSGSGPNAISPMNVFGLALDPLDRDIMYAGTANGRIYTTADGGATWALLWQYTGQDDAIWTLEVDPEDGGRLFAGTGDYTSCDGRIYRSEDQGATWDKVLDLDPGTNPDQGFISSITFDPTDSNIVYATTGIGDFCGGGNPGDPNPVGFGIWKSEDSGDSWTAINNGLEDLTVSHLVIDPDDTQTLYAGVGCVDDDIRLPGNVFKSVDGGANWARLDVSPDQPITRLALHPDDPQKVYAMGYNGFFGSEDGGANWARLNETFKSAVYTFFYDHAFAPGDPETMYVGTYAGGLIKSVDGGHNWFEINGLRHEGDVLGNSYGTALDPTDPDTLYATTIGGVFKTTNGGESWRFIGQGLFQHLRQIAADPTNPLRLYLGGDSLAFYLSDDGGETWQEVSLDQNAPAVVGGDIQFPAIAVDPHSPNRILVGLTNADASPMLRSTDWGQSWQPVSPGFPAQAHALAYHPTVPGTVYAGLGWRPQDPKLMRSQDGGLTWDDAAPGLNLVTVYAMVEANGVLRTATNGGGMYVRWPGNPPIWENWSHGEGGNWVSYLTRLASDGGNPDTLLTFDRGDRTLYRQVGENPWQAVLRLPEPGDEVYDLAFDPGDPDRAYATTRLSGLWRSLDNGLTWHQAGAGLPGGVPLRGLTRGQDSTLYTGQLGVPGRLFASGDGGDTWAPLNDAFTFSTVHAFAADPTDGDVAYAGLWGGGTWKTENGGASWDLLPNAPVSAAALAVHPMNPQMIYATDRTEPVLWQSADGGQHWWRRFHAGSEYSRLMALAVDPHRPNTVYVSAFKRGGYGAEGSLFRLTWGHAADVTHELPRVPISLAISPDQPGLLLASTHIYGLYRSVDGGGHWQQVEDGLPRVGFNAMAWDPASGDLYGGACSGSFPDYLRPPGLPDGDAEPGLYRSRDDGLTWQRVKSGVVGKGFAFAGGAVYAAADNLVYLSIDGGDTWTPQPGGPPADLGTLAGGGGRLYAGSLGSGVHTATVNPDRSLTWSGSGGPAAEIHAIQLLALPGPGPAGTLFATAFPGGVFKSTDGGATWHEANFGLPGFSLPDPARNGYYALVANPLDPDNLYLGIYGYGVYRSDDGAATWLPANTGLGNRYVYSLHVENGGTHIWAGTNDGVQSLWRSPTGTPGRLDWAPVTDGPEGWKVISGIALNPENPDEMTIAAFPSGVFSTSDGGAHWYERSNNLDLGKRRTHGVGFEDGYYQLAADPVNPRHLFLGTYSGQVYETRDGGQSWTPFYQGLMREGSIYSFEIDPAGSRLYVSQKAGGVSRRALDPAAPQRRVVSAGGPPCTDGSHTYAAVGAALAAANPGDELVVCPGVYDEEVVVDKALRLDSFAGPAQTTLHGLVVTADGARVSGFRLRSLEVDGAAGVELWGNVVIEDEIYLPLVLKN